MGVRQVKFKTEVCLLSVALLLFVVSAFFYSYQAGSVNLNLNLAFPYQGYSLLMVCFGSVFTFAAFVSYSRRGNSIYAEN